MHHNLLRIFNDSITHIISKEQIELDILNVDYEKAIRAIVKSSVKTFAGAFNERAI